MYAHDSFFTLSALGQIGLAALSVGLSVGMLMLCRNLPFGALPRGAIAILLGWVFVWLSPQVYYQYYRLIFEGLPAQWVIHSPPTVWECAALITFTGPQTLSAHSLGVLLWACFCAALTKNLKLRRNAAN